MPQSLQAALDVLRDHETELRGMGVAHAAVFGSIARGEANPASDIDVLVELDETKAVGIFQYPRLKLHFQGLFNVPADVVNQRALKPLLRDNILRDAVHAF